jgi:hypothetical protein
MRINMFLIFNAFIWVLCPFVQGQIPTNDPNGWPHNATTPTWEEGIAAFSALADLDPRATWMELGTTDSGKPLHALLIAAEPVSMPGLPGVIAAREAHPERIRFLVNNAIHPGEPCGVDASLALARQLLGLPHLPEGMGDEAGEWDGDAAGIWPTAVNRSWEGAPADWSNALIAIIPFYNVGGALNRGCCSRANQNGPLAYGFRGNARNYDLNRDFMKMDTENAASFARFFAAFDPDVFVDTHTTNGADYPYTMTCITTQPDKAGPILGDYLRNEWDAAMYERMEAVGYPMSPYVYGRAEVPDSGLVGFLETPRYSTGFAALWGTLGFTAEAHMLKPYPERVQSMLNFLQVTLGLALEEASKVKTLREEEHRRLAQSDSLAIRWKAQSEAFTPIAFTGYTAVNELSTVTGSPRLRYNRQRSWSRTIPFYNQCEPAQCARVPAAYIIPRGWSHVVDRLRANGVAIRVVPEPMELEVEATYVVDWHSSKQPYEGHHVNSVDSLVRRREWVRLEAGDFIVSTGQRSRRYLVEALEVEAHDSFWVWGAFDSALQRKEHYSAYVFEDTAAEMLASDAVLAAEFAEAQILHPEWASSPDLALRWLYERSPFSEPGGGRYPVLKTVD